MATPRRCNVASSTRHADLGRVQSDAFGDCSRTEVAHTDVCAIVKRGLAQSCDSNCMPVKKKREFSDFVTPAVPLRCGGDCRRLAGRPPFRE